MPYTCIKHMPKKPRGKTRKKKEDLTSYIKRDIKKSNQNKTGL